MNTHFGNKSSSGGFARLRKDRAGNTMAMMAVAMIPLSALAGSGVDMARLYVVKARLQQACDAGVLAGRKFMASTDSPTLDTAAAQHAANFFDNNFREGWLGTTNADFTPTKSSDNQVLATAEVTVPMTIMRMFGSEPTELSVNCEARYDVGDVDVMFVLDTTGSMACPADESSSCGQPTASFTRPDGTTGYKVVEKSGARMPALRQAVLDFYDTLAASADPTTNIRYGIVPYSSTVNVGAVLLPENFVTEWAYQSRRVIGDSNSGSSSHSTPSAANKDACDAMEGRSPASGYDSDGRAMRTTTDWSSGTCNRWRQPLVPRWRYAQHTTDVSQYVRGTFVQDPSKVTTSFNRWQGCIEERRTTATAVFDAKALPPDLDPDLAPAISNNDTLWRPMWPEQIYDRGNSNQLDTSDNRASLGGDRNYLLAGYAPCPKPVQRLAKLSRAQVRDYVYATDFVSIGGTYHDTGMIWGTRLISPTGPFKGDTAAWPGRPAPQRHIVFMTDGEMSPNPDVYGMYGVERSDRRIADGDLSDNRQLNRHNARFTTVCTAAKARNITVWVVAFGSSLNDDLKGCATTTGQAFFAADDATLKKQFKDIAKQVAMLRLSK